MKRSLLIALLVGACSRSAPSVQGRVLDGTGAPLGGVEVKVLGDSTVATSDAQGEFTVAHQTSDTQFALRFAKAGFGSAYRQTVEGARVEVILSLAPKAHAITLPAAGSSVQVAEGSVTLTIPGGTMTLPNGSAASGEAQVTVVPYDPLLPARFPATMRTVNGETLASGGMAEIHVEQGDQRLQPAAGQPLQIAFRAGAALKVPDPSKYKLYYLNEETALWEVGGDGSWDATRTTFTTSLPHLSIPNADVPMDCPWTVSGTVRDGHNKTVANVVVNGGGEWGWGGQASTNAIGSYELTAAVWCLYPQPTTFTLQHSIAGQTLETPSATRTMATDSPATVDFQFCLNSEQKCVTTDRCCSGKCSDGFCI